MQGVNHAYNLQGWLKTFNPDVQTGGGYTLKADGSTGSVVGKPAYQVMLNYFNGDYKAISGATPWNGAGALGGDYRQLYNGNISSMAVSIEKLGNPLLYNYQYDQLNRLVTMDAWQKGSDWGSLTARSDFQERISYDPNGNILGYKRNGKNTFAGKPLGMDSHNYNYVMGTNRLDHVSDSVPAGNYTEDIDNQTAGNYDYDAIGNLVKDNAEGITSISWTVYGKIRQIVKGDSVVISYTYDPSGNRISKAIIKSGSTDTARTWYVRDAQGNVMSVYEAGRPSVNEGHLTQSELHLYGSSRIGLLRRSFDVAEEYNPADTTMPLLGTGLSHTFGRGNKLFELSNHLGNVLVTVNDKKLGVSSNNNTVDYFNPQVVSAQDYYPFGMLQVGRSMNVGGYRYGFNAQEMSNEIKGLGNSYTAQFWEYDSRIGRRWNIDPIYKHSSYECFGGNPIRFVDVNGQDSTIYMYSYKAKVSGTVLDGPGKKAVGEILNNVKRIMEANGLKGLKYKLIDQEDFTSGKLKLDPSDAILGVTGANGGEAANGVSYRFEPNEAPVPRTNGFPSSWISTVGDKEFVEKTKSDFLAISSISATHEVLHQLLFKADRMFRLNDGNGIHFDHTLNLNSTGDSKQKYLSTEKITFNNLLSHTTEGKIAYIQKFQVVYITGYFNALKAGVNPSGADAEKSSTMKHVFPSSSGYILIAKIEGLKSWLNMMTTEN